MIGVPQVRHRPGEVPESSRAPARSANNKSWTAELSLLATCCRWPPSADRDALVREKARAAIDWDRFAQTVRRHRVPVLAAEGLQRAGLTVPPDTAAYAAQTASQGLHLAREAIRLQRAFDDAGISALFVKGSTLAMLAYGDLGKKHSADIDLTISPGEASAAGSLLRRLGYELSHPPLDDDQFARYVSFEKESTFLHAGLGMAVDLHWRLSDNRRLLPEVLSGAPRQEVRLGGGIVRTLADEPLFAYLCVHGTLHGWARLKWLADVAAFLSHRGEPEITRLYEYAVRASAGRTPAVALMLCHRLLGTSLEPDLLRSLEKDRAVESLVATAMACLAEGAGIAELGRYSRTGVRLTLSHFRTVPGSGYAWSQLNRVFTSGWDRALFTLPRPLGFLYYLLRGPSFAARLVLRTYRARLNEVAGSKTRPK